MTIKAIITIPDNIDSDAVVAAVNEILSENGYLEQGVEIETTTRRLSKSDKVILEMAAIVKDGTYLDRNGIAAKVECTVSLISATIKENAELKTDANAKDISDHKTVSEYLALERNAKAMKKAQTQYQNFLKMQAELAKAGIVLPFPTTATEEATEEATKATEAVSEATGTEEATVTEIASKAPSRRSSKPANA